MLRKEAQAVERLRDEGIDAHVVELDVTSGASVRAAAQRIRGRPRRGSTFSMNNAGILPEAAGPHAKARWTSSCSAGPTRRTSSAP